MAMAFTKCTIGTGFDGGLTGETYRTYEANVNYLLVAETGRSKIHIHLAGADQMSSRRRISNEAALHECQQPSTPVTCTTYHQVLQQALGMLHLHIDATCAITRLLQKHCISRNLADINRHAQLLRREDAVHDRHILVRQIARDTHDEDPRRHGRNVGTRYLPGPRNRRADAAEVVAVEHPVDVCERERERARHLRLVCARERGGRGGGDERAERRLHFVFDLPEETVFGGIAVRVCGVVRGGAGGAR